VDTAKQRLKLSFDRITALRWAILSCAKGGTVSMPGVYGGLIDKLPMGAAFAKGLTFKMGQTHVQRYLKPLLERIQRAEIDPTFIISHRLELADAPIGYQNFQQNKDEWTKIVLKP
jgi:threonine dehydrogenase-like Zn-dependent dehydrogenase